MPETYEQMVDRVLRDHEAYSGDGAGGNGTLPVGDRSSAAKPISKRDLRAVLKAPVSFAVRAEKGAEDAEAVVGGLGTLQSAVNQAAADKAAAEAAAAQSALSRLGADAALEATLDAAGSQGYFATVALGLAGTTDGDAFWTIVGAERLDYLNDSGAAVLLRRSGFQYDIVETLPVSAATGVVYLVPEPEPEPEPEKLSVQLVDDLPTAPEPNVMYLVPSDGGSGGAAVSDVVMVTAGTPRATVQQMLNDNPGKIVRLLAGSHFIGPIYVPAHTVLEIPPLAIVRWHPTVTLVNENAIIKVLGGVGDLITGTMIELLGEVDGDESDRLSAMPEKLEGINLVRSSDCMVQGNGIVRNIREDGIDLDAGRRVKVFGVTVLDCGGFGVHLGGNLDDYIPDQSAAITNVWIEGCGFHRPAAGIDMNPNWGDAVFTGITVKDCYQNYYFYEPSVANEVVNRRVVTGCRSINTGAVVASDSGLNLTKYCQIDEKVYINGVQIGA